MASGGNPLLAKTGITPKANTHMVLWGVMSPLKGRAVFRRRPPSSPKGKIKIGTDTIIVTIRGVRGHDRACHELLEPLHPATRIM
jgi:hypothetical protein